MDDAYIKIRQLTKLYPMGREVVRALAGIDLDIPRKSMTVIMGPSGSGKSTLLYLLGGLDRPTSGTIQVDGLSVETMDENLLAEYRRNRIGFVFSILQPGFKHEPPGKTLISDAVCRRQ